MRVTFRQRGDLSKTERFLRNAQAAIKFRNLETYAEQGLTALQNSTPYETGETARCWYYTIERTSNSVSVIYKNSNIQNGVQIAVILQYGHGTGTGGYVEGRDYINPAVRPVFDKLADDIWEEVIGR